MENFYLVQKCVIFLKPACAGLLVLGFGHFTAKLRLASAGFLAGLIVCGIFFLETTIG